MDTDGRNKIKYIYTGRHSIGLMLVLCLSVLFFGIFTAYANEAEHDLSVPGEVRVAFFPMNGFHMTTDDGTMYGMDVEYLRTLSNYTEDTFTFVPCDSWEAALKKLKEHEVDLVGSAQYSDARAREYDFVQLPSGYTFGVVAVNPDSTLAFEDFPAFRNIRFGMVGGYVRSDEFYSYMAENGVPRPQVVLYPNTQALFDALDCGEVQAMVHTFTEVRQGQRMVGQFAPRSFYYITYKNNDVFLHRFNQALATMKMQEPEFEAILMKDYYQGQYDPSILLNYREKQYVAEHPSMMIGYIDDNYPFIYRYKETAKGLSLTMLDKLSQNTGIHFGYQYFASAEAALDALEKQEIDMLCINACADEEIEDRGLITTRPYAESPPVLIGRRNGELTELKQIAVTPNLVEETMMGLGVREETLRIYQTTRECLAAVAVCDVDAAVCDGYQSDYLINATVQLDGLVIKRVLMRSRSICMLLNGEADAVLQGILRKNITLFNSSEIGKYVLKDPPYVAFSLAGFMDRYSSYFLSGILLITFVALLVILRMVHDSRKINQLLYKDYRLDVWNMNYLHYSIERMLQNRKKGVYSMASICIAEFRLYNSIYGRDGGDALIRALADQLKKNISREDGHYAREHADHFAIILYSQDIESLKARVYALQQSIEDGFREATGCKAAILMGAAINSNREDVDDALAHASMAAELAGQEPHHVRFYDDRMNEKMAEEREREERLEKVSMDDNFVAFYQAKVDIRTGRMVGAEALARFCGPATGGEVIAPYFFVPYFERTGRVVELDFAIFRDVCRMLRSRLDRGLPVLPISCNFSRIHFLETGFAERFRAVLNEFGVPGDLVEVEITETLVVDEYDSTRVLENIQDIALKGVRLSIDDFGSGYSSLGIFEQIPASVIKMDRSFLLNQKDKDRQVAIMKGIVTMGNALGAQVVCEGVENEQDVAIMREVGAYIAQGYYYAKPVSRADFEKRLEEENA